MRVIYLSFIDKLLRIVTDFLLKAFEESSEQEREERTGQVQAFVAVVITVVTFSPATGGKQQAMYTVSMSADNNGLHINQRHHTS